MGSFKDSTFELANSTKQKIPHLAAGDFLITYNQLIQLTTLTELTSSRGDQERGVGEDIANSKVC